MWFLHTTQIDLQTLPLQLVAIVLVFGISKALMFSGEIWTILPL